MTEKLIIISNFKTECDGSRYYYFQIVSSNDPNFLSNDAIPKLVCLPHILKHQNLQKRKERLFNKASGSFLKLELKLKNVTSISNSNGNIIEEVIDDMNLEEENLLDVLVKSDDPSYCYVNDDPDNDIILCLNNGEFIRHACPQHMVSKSNVTTLILLFLDKKVSNLFSSEVMSPNICSCSISMSSKSTITGSIHSNTEDTLKNTSSAINPNSAILKIETTNNDTSSIHSSNRKRSYSDINSDDESIDLLEQSDIQDEQYNNKINPSKWTQDTLLAVAQKYNTRAEFKRKSSFCYEKARSAGILEDICQHMESKRTIWTDDMLRELALKYQNKHEFYEGNKLAYKAALRRKILEEICKHMKAKSRTKWTNEMLAEEAKKYCSRYQFSKIGGGAYQAAYKRKIIDDICKHMDKPEPIVWNDNNLQEEALKYTTKSDFSKSNNIAYQEAIKLGILNKICRHMQSESSRRQWSDGELREEAIKYNTRDSFSNRNPTAYWFAQSRGKLDEICQHMK